MIHEMAARAATGAAPHAMIEADIARGWQMTDPAARRSVPRDVQCRVAGGRHRN
jgi:hypothetical protein